MSHVAYICTSNITRVTIVRLFLFEELHFQRPYSNTDVRITELAGILLLYVLNIRALERRSAAPVTSIALESGGGCSQSPFFHTAMALTTSSAHYRKRSRVYTYGLPYPYIRSLLAIAHSSHPWRHSVPPSTHPPRTPRLLFAVTRPPCGAAAAGTLTPNEPHFRAFFCVPMLNFNNVLFAVCGLRL